MGESDRTFIGVTSQSNFHLPDRSEN